ncbi:MAG: hypothetical protein ACOH2V_00970 [Candidatus Saccharimonadaceae bacterium]
MKILKIVYDKNTLDILNVVDKIPVKVYVETFNISNYKEKKKAIPIMTRHGTSNVPLLVFEDENLEEYAAVWSESKPDWLVEINKILLNE